MGQPTETSMAHQMVMKMATLMEIQLEHGKVRVKGPVRVLLTVP